MKKSKLIVPAALAVMLLSTAASVTGTVAWFTANRAVSIEADNFEVVSTDGSLSYRITAGNCTSVTTVDGKDKVSITSGKRLTDASVDVQPNSMTVFTDEALESGDQPTEFSTVSSTYVVAGTSDSVYYCATWTITFTYEFGGAQSKVDLFFNAKDSVMTAGATTKAAANSSTMDTSKSFRIGMYSQTNAIVFADLESLANCNYITGTTTPAPAVSGNAGSWAAYEAAAATNARSKPILVDSANSLALAEDGSAHTDRGDLLGTITKGDETSATFVVNCVAWFEGTDPNTINDAIFKKMAATLKFYTRSGATL